MGHFLSMGPALRLYIEQIQIHDEFIKNSRTRYLSGTLMTSPFKSELILYGLNAITARRKRT